ncbi:MAG: DinB family protein [Actinomycetota bacterium]|nr:DinB family protein [Actinomycetota bacterium]
MSGWTAPSSARADPDLVASERVALEQWLDYHRGTVLTKCAGLTGEQLARRSVPPSTMSLLGLVRHLTEVERWWLRRHAGGEDLQQVYCTPGSPDGDFDDAVAEGAEADLAAYAREIEAARAAIAGRDLEVVVPSRGHLPGRERNVRWIYLHVIEEYARHNGHADLLRELVDGATGE